MKLHLDHIPKKSPFSIDHDHNLLLIGSCFSGNVGSLLSEHRFNATVNPTGILYNPAAILRSLENCLSGHLPSRTFQRGETWYSFDHHSSFSASTEVQLRAKINNASDLTAAKLKKADFLFITFGTAFKYELVSDDRVVANCHKWPSENFRKSIMQVPEIVMDFEKLVSELVILNPSLKIVFTVSPVKHLRDGVEENNLSKSVLRVAINEVVTRYENCFYFPAFELINDDLRDYRFYKEDLAHPNDLAIRYVWEKFMDCYFDLNTKTITEKIRELNNVMNHKPLNQNHGERNKTIEFISRQKESILKLKPGIVL